ncbi:MAG TPA: hypothetical protein VFP06_17600 [Acidimicrobiales bacterium]|nr:hypothetical protein [Acidimicrobiales bacterium]
MSVRRAGALALAALALAAGAACTPRAHDIGDEPVERVLVVSLPGLDWDQVRESDLPNLERFVDGAAVADLTTRIGRRSAGATDAYMTMGAGTRAVAPLVDTAVAVEPDETYGGVPAAELLERRLGTVPGGIAYLGIGAAVDANVSSAYGAEVGTLGDRLAEAGVRRAVIANADAVEGWVSEDPPPEGSYARGAATMLMGADGIVPEGAVSRSLLHDDPDAAFGWRLDDDRVLAAFDEAWDAEGPVVVLVEASDMSRAAAYRGRATAAQGRALREQALVQADALLGALVERTDPARDAVIVLSPVAPSASPALGVAAVRAPGVDAGLLQSATTRRDGYVQLADVAPTVLTLLGEEPPSEIEGRSFQLGGTPGGDRLEHLAHQAEAAAFRDATLPLAVVGITAALALLALATTVRHRLPPRARRMLAPLAYAALGVVPASFLVGQVDAARGRLALQVAIVVAVAAAVALAAQVAEWRRPGAGPLVAVGAIVALIGLDLAVGAPLQLNTTFGYSVAVAGRFTGLGNLAFALFGSATIVLAALIVDRTGRRGLWAAVAVMAAVVVIEGLPMLGADVGGVVAMVPAFGVTALVLVGRRVGWREVALLAVATSGVLFAFALVDAARPAEVQTHLARVAEQVLDGRWDIFSKNLGRRWQASLGGAELAGWVTVAAVMTLALVYAALVAAGRIGPGATRPLRHRPTLAAATGLAVLGVVGLVANDSSVAVPLTMLIVAAPAFFLQALAPPPGAAGVPPEGVAS